MNQAQFVQVPCVKCGTVVWIAPAAGVGYCPSCHTPNQLPAGGAAAAPPGAPGATPGAPGMPQPPAAGYGAPHPAFAGVAAGGPSKFKIIGGGVLAVVAATAVGGAKLWFRNLGKDPGKESLSSLSITPKKGDPDRMISAASAYAKKWRSDAVFRSVTIMALGADGTQDLTDKNVVVEYFSPSGVSSAVKSLREDSIKKYNFMGDDMTWDTKMIWGPTKQLTSPPPATKIPGCSAKMLAAALVKQGTLKPGTTVQVSLDPNFSETSWIVQAPSGPLHFDAATCTPRKD